MDEKNRLHSSILVDIRHVAGHQTLAGGKKFSGGYLEKQLSLPNVQLFMTHQRAYQTFSVTTKVVRLETTKTRSHKGTKKEKVVTAKVDSSAPLRPRLNPRATGAKPHWGSAVQPRGLGKGSPEVQLRAKKQAEARYVSSYHFPLNKPTNMDEK